MTSNFKYSYISVHKKESSHYLNREKDFNVYTELNYNSFGVDFSISQDKNAEASKKRFIHNLSTANDFNISSGILPPAIKYSIPGVIVFERPPSQQVVQYIPSPVHSMGDEDEIHTFRIPIPWQLYIITYDPKTYLCNSVRMLFMKSSLNSINQRMYMPPLPNFFTNGSLCRPMYSEMEDIERYSKDLAGVINSAYDWIWNSGFNHDLTENIYYLRVTKTPVELIDDNTFRYSDGSNYFRSIGPKAICSVFSNWENISFENILNLSWPNPSLTRSFEDDMQYYIDNDYDRFEAEDSEQFPTLHEEEQNYSQVINSIFYEDTFSNRMGFNNAMAHAFALS